MQRTWKILSETSADDNRSSPSNSSDDSDCSTQTIHSMSTSMIASPPGTASLSSMSSLSPRSGEDSPIEIQPTSPFAELATSSASEDAQDDKENETRSYFSELNKSPTPTTKTDRQLDEKLAEEKENEIKAFFELPGDSFITTSELALTTLQRLKQRLSGNYINNGSNSESAMRALELLRITVQSAFDRDIDVTIRRYMELYFRPAFRNIKENLGESAVSDEMLQKMSCALLENAKEQYHGLRLRQNQVHLCTTSNSNRNGAVAEQQALPLAATPMSASQPAATTRATLKRTCPPPSSNGSVINGNNLQQKRAFSAISARTQPNASQNQLNVSERRTAVSVGAAPIQQQSQQNFQQPMQHEQQPQPPLPQQQNQQQQPQQQSPFQTTAPQAPPTARRQIYWNTANISSSTKFVLDVQANQAFGFGTDGRERLASKHPELIRYLPDTDDRSWLQSQGIISPQSRNTRFLLLIYDEVFNLKGHEYYRSKPNVDLTIMRTFVVPEFIIQKMRHFFVDLNIKSRGLITNSFSMGAASTGGSALNPLSNFQFNTSNCTSNAVTASAAVATTPPVTATTTAANNNNNTNNNNNNSNSQLRSALLHGQSPQLQASLFNEDTLMGCGSTTNDFVTTTTLNDSTSTGSGVNFFQPTRTSTLSSSHATLTALLNNTTSPASGGSTSRFFGRNNDRSMGNSRK